MAMWSLLGERGVDMLAWKAFGEGWGTDVVKQLKLKDVRKLLAPNGALPISPASDFSRDVVLHLERHDLGRPRRRCVVDSADRGGLTICDATSAAFAQDLDFAKLDVVTFSWQKVLGGEGTWCHHPVAPRGGAARELYAALAAAQDLPHDQRRQADCRNLEGETINTPSMLCVEDYIVALNWAKGHRRASGPHRAGRRKRWRGAALDRPARLRAESRARRGDAFEHLGASRWRRMRPRSRRWSSCSRPRA